MQRTQSENKAHNKANDNEHSVKNKNKEHTKVDCSELT
jgi:hypothetical protein